MGSSVERSRPRPNPFAAGPCPIEYHEHLMKARLYRCMTCMLLVTTQRRLKVVQIAAGEPDGSGPGQDVKDLIESEKVAAGEQTKAHGSDEESQKTES